MEQGKESGKGARTKVSEPLRIPKYPFESFQYTRFYFFAGEIFCFCATQLELCIAMVEENLKET